MTKTESLKTKYDKEVKQAMGINYFADSSFLEEVKEKYNMQNFFIKED